MATSARKLSVLTGIITHAHRCENTVRVRVMKQTWNKKLRKFFSHPIGFLADDHAKACVAGDVVRVACGHLRTSSTKRHVVDKIVSPARTGEVRTEPEGVQGWLARQNERRFIKWAKKDALEETEVKASPLLEAERARVNKELREQRDREWELMTEEEREVVKKAAFERNEAEREAKREARKAWEAMSEEEKLVKRQEKRMLMRQENRKVEQEANRVVREKKEAVMQAAREAEREAKREAKMEAEREEKRKIHEQNDREWDLMTEEERDAVKKAAHKRKETAFIMRQAKIAEYMRAAEVEKETVV